MRCLAALLLAFCAASPAASQALYSLTPNPATTADHVQVRVDVDECYDDIIVVEVDLAARTITGRTHGNKLPCDPFDPHNTVTPRLSAVGQLPAGIYQARLISCTDFAPEPGCFTVFHEETLVVRSVASKVVGVPAVSGWLLVVFALGAGGIAVRALRAARGSILEAVPEK